MKSLLPVLALPILLGSAAHAKDGEYLFDTLKKRPYRAAWDRLLKGQNVDPWLTNYARTLDGPATPSKTVRVNGVAYQQNGVCKRHDCGENHFVVLFAPGGKQAWGVLQKRGAVRFLGNPNPAVREALRKAEQE